MKEFDKLLYTLSKSTMKYEDKINVLKITIQDITSFGIGTQDNIKGHLSTITDIIQTVEEPK